MGKRADKYQSLCIYLILAVAAIIAFAPVRHCSFVNYDDRDHVTENPYVRNGITWQGIRWAFTTTFSRNWIPLAWLSHMLDCELFGLRPGWHHLSSLLLHVANTLLLFAVLKRMTGRLWCSGFVAAAFALHPQHVEPVAWIGARNHLLSTFFWILTMAAYVRYVKKKDAKNYVLAILFFILGLMAKPTLWPLPFVLLLLDYWPLGRFSPPHLSPPSSQRKIPFYFFSSLSSRRWLRLIWEKVPFFALTLASAVATFILQREIVGMAGVREIPLKIRIAYTPVAYIKYIEKMFWPSRLAMFYPHPGEKLSMPLAAVAAVLLAISVLVIRLAVYRSGARLARRRGYLFVGWLWFIVTLLPVIGLVQVGDQGALADRYTYIPFIGLFIIIAWGIPELLAKLPYRRVALGAATLALLSALSICTYIQAGYWRNSITLFEHAFDVTEDNYVAHFSIGEPLRNEGRIDEAIYHNSECLRIRPDYIKAHNGLGLALLEAGRIDKAITSFNQALQLDRDCYQARVNLGVALVKKGHLDEAVKQYAMVLGKYDLPIVHSNLAYALALKNRFAEAEQEYRKALQMLPDSVEVNNGLGAVLSQQGKLEQAVRYFLKVLQIEPDFADAHSNMGYVLARQGKLDEAITYYTEALRIKPDFADAHYNFGVALVRQGKLDEAIPHFIKSLQVEPDNAEAHVNLGVALARQGKLDEAIKHYTEALRIKTDFAGARNNLGYALAYQGRLDEAIIHYTEALRIKPDFADAHYNLGAALAQQGKLDEAITHFTEALRIRPDFAGARQKLKYVLDLLAKSDKATTYSQEAVQLDPNSSD